MDQERRVVGSLYLSFASSRTRLQPRSVHPAASSPFSLATVEGTVQHNTCFWVVLKWPKALVLGDRTRYASVAVLAPLRAGPGIRMYSPWFDHNGRSPLLIRDLQGTARCERDIFCLPSLEGRWHSLRRGRPQRCDGGSGRKICLLLQRHVVSR